MSPDHTATCVAVCVALHFLTAPIIMMHLHQGRWQCHPLWYLLDHIIARRVRHRGLFSLGQVCIMIARAKFSFVIKPATILLHIFIPHVVIYTNAACAVIFFSSLKDLCGNTLPKLVFDTSRSMSSCPSGSPGKISFQGISSKEWGTLLSPHINLRLPLFDQNTVERMGDYHLGHPYICR